jgi:hypothetical protein
MRSVRLFAKSVSYIENYFIKVTAFIYFIQPIINLTNAIRIVEQLVKPAERIPALLILMRNFLGVGPIQTGMTSREELKFTQHLSKDPHEYKGHSRPATLAQR